MRPLAYQRSKLFDQEAELYDRCRPRYPAAVMDEVVGPEPARLTILDVGCGTGIALRQMVEREAKVLGVEVAPRMAAIARRHGIDVEVGAFEDWDASGRTFDRITSAQAWHWLDLPLATSKAASLLRPGGRLCLIWNAGCQPRPTRMGRSVRRAKRPVEGHLRHADSLPAQSQPASSHNSSSAGRVGQAADSGQTAGVRKQYHFWPGSRGLDAWDVDSLIEATRSLPTEDVALDDLPEIDSVYWFDSAELPTVRRVVEHLRLVEEVDTEWPIILGPGNRVMDGMHRVARALLEGRTTIRAVRLEILPEPDYRDCRPEDLPY